MEMVRFFDVDSGRVVSIPASELAPGAIRAHIQGVDEVVWVLPEKLKEGPIRHPPFNEGIRGYIRQIQEAFAEHRPLSFEEWEIGFRRDANPAQEIALWLHAADVYTAFTGDEPSAERRHEVYRCVLACMNGSRDNIWHVFRHEALSRAEAEQVVKRFYGGGGEPAETDGASGDRD